MEMAYPVAAIRGQLRQLLQIYRMESSHNSCRGRLQHERKWGGGTGKLIALGHLASVQALQWYLARPLLARAPDAQHGLRLPGGFRQRAHGKLIEFIGEW